MSSMAWLPSSRSESARSAAVDVGAKLVGGETFAGSSARTRSEGSSVARQSKPTRQRALFFIENGIFPISKELAAASSARELSSAESDKDAKKFPPPPPVPPNPPPPPAPRRPAPARR